MPRAALLLAALLSITTPATAGAPERNDSAEAMRSLGLPVLRGKKLERAVTQAEAHPLGSRENPIRVDGPAGERAYLARLVCDNGSRPLIGLRENVGFGVYGTILDLYPLSCGDTGPAADIHMDMYFQGTEVRPPPGFSIDPEQDSLPTEPASPASPST